MKLNAVGVTSKDLKRSLEFYKILGFKFPEQDGDGHIESITETGSIKLMIDREDIVKEIIGEIPTPSNHSQFALEYNSAEEVNAAIEEIRVKGFTISKEPWDAFWGQRYAIVKDPSGYMVDLYAAL